jgi:hypothetical protein
VRTWAEPEDRGYADTVRDRFRLTYEATFGGGGEGDWVVFDTTTNQQTAYRTHVYGAQWSYRQDRERVVHLRELFASENERWRERQRLRVVS